MIQQFDNDTDQLEYNQLVQLEGAEYLFRFLWSDREQSPYCDISDQDGNVLAAGIKLVLGQNLLDRFTDPTLPPGALILIDLSGKEQEISAMSELGNRCPLIYITSDDDLITGADTGSDN